MAATEGEEHKNEKGNNNILMEGAGHSKHVKNTFAIIVSLTFDIETLFFPDDTFSIPDCVASLICTCDSAEGDLLRGDADATLVTFDKLPRMGQQHQTWSAEGKKINRLCICITCKKCLCRIIWVKISMECCWFHLDVKFASTALGL